MSYMNIGISIRQLLPENETVIFPGIGAFFLQYSPAEIDNEADVIFPPSGRLKFNSKIKNDDGLLAGHIAETENISIRDANLKIKEIRDEILYQLDKGNKTEIENLGIFFHDENHEIQFEPFPGENLFAETYGLEGISLKEEDKVSEEIAENAEFAIPPEESSADIIETEPDAEDDFPEIKTAPPVQKPPETSPKKRRGWLWLLLLIFLLLVAAILFFVLKEEKKEIPAQKPLTTFLPDAEKVPAEEQKDSLVADSLFFEADVSVADSIKIDEPDIASFSGFATPDTSVYYLIGGSFSRLKNAEEYFQEMKSKGYSPLHLGKQGSFYLVSIKVFKNKAEAFREQYDFLDRLPDSGVWVFKPEKMEE